MNHALFWFNRFFQIPLSASSQRTYIFIIGTSESRERFQETRVKNTIQLGRTRMSTPPPWLPLHPFLSLRGPPSVGFSRALHVAPFPRWKTCPVMFGNGPIPFQIRIDHPAVTGMVKKVGPRLREITPRLEAAMMWNHAT